MNIIQTPVRVSSTGGVERYVHDLSSELASRGHCVTVVCAGSQTVLRSEGEYSITSLKSLFRIANTEITPLLFPALMSENFTLIHTHIPTPWSADVSMLVAWIKKKPFIVTYHNDITAYGLYSPFARIYNRIFLPLILKKAKCILINRVHHPSIHLKKFSHKLIHIPPGVNVEHFKEGKFPKIGDIFFLSVLDEYHKYKGIEILFSAVQSLQDQFPELKVIVGGSGPAIEHYKQKTYEMGIENNLIFTGYIPDDDLQRYYCGTSVFVLPSTDPSREGFGLVLLEAMACGRPVITTDIAGMTEDIINYRSGIIIPGGDPDALAKAIGWVMEHTTETEAMGKAARELVEDRYDWKAITDSIERIYVQYT